MNTIADFKQCVILKLQSHFTKRLTVEAYPETPQAAEDYTFMDSGGAILVQFAGRPKQGLTPSSSLKSVRFYLTFLLPSLAGETPVEDLIEETEVLFHQWWPCRDFPELVTVGGPASLDEPRFVWRTKDTWQYQANLTIPNIPFPIGE